MENVATFEPIDPVTSLLTLGGDSVFYTGQGATFSNPLGSAIESTTIGPGTDRFVLNDTFDVRSGLIVNNWGTGVEIEVQGGTIAASDNAIFVQTGEAAAAVNIEIAAGAVLRSSIPIQIMNGGISNVTVSGRLEGGDVSISALGDGDFVLELHPGYFIGGVVDAAQSNKTLILGGAGNATFALGDIGTRYLSFNRFRKTGSSSWTLTGQATQGVNIEVEAGSLWLDASGALLSTDKLTIAADGRFGGIGTAGDIDVYGVLSPGYQAGTLMAGDAVFHPGSILEIDSATDRLDVASLDIGEERATLRVLPTAGVFDFTTIVQSVDEIEGHFVLEPMSSRYLAALHYSAHSIDLSVTASGKTFQDFARNPAQQIVAAQLDALGTAAPFYAQLDQMADDEIVAFLAQLAGTDLTATGEILIKEAGGISAAALGRIQQQGSAIGPTTSALGYATAVASLLDPAPASLWGRLVSGVSSYGGSTSGSTTLIGGADLTFGDDAALGVLLGAGGGAMTAGNTSARTSAISAGLYGSQSFGDTALRIVASAGVNLVDARRRVTAGGVDETYTALYPALGAQLLIEAAQRFHLGPVTAELFGDLAYSVLAAPDYTESGGPGALTVGATRNDAVETTLGARLSRQVAMGTVLATVGGSLGWTHRFAAAPTATHSFAGSAPFEVTGQASSGDALRASLDLRLDLDEQSGLDLAYTAQWQPDGAAHSISAKYARRL